MKILLELGASASLPNTVQGRTLWSGATSVPCIVYPLAAAVESQDAFIIQLLLSNGAPVEHCKGGMQCLFHQAVQLDCENLLKLVLLVGKMQEKDIGLELTAIDLGEPLMTAVRLQKFRMARVLLELGADPNYCQSGGMLPLVAAANNGDTVMCNLLLEKGATLGRTTGNVAMHTPLTRAVMAGLECAVSILIELGSDVNMVTDLGMLYGSRGGSISSGCTILHHAVGKNHLPIAKQLIDAGCVINCKDSKGNTPLHIICMDRSGNFGLVKYLLQLAKDKTLSEDRLPETSATNLQGCTPLMLAISCRNTEIASLLIQADVDLEVHDKQHLSALHHAVKQGSDVLVLDLLESGASVNSGKKNVSTPLHEAIRNNDYTIVGILLEHNANVYCKTVLKETPLHLAVQSQGEELVECFLNLGVDINAKTKDGETALMIAAAQDNCDICELLITSGANMDCHDYCQEETALLLSVYFGFEGNAKILITHGADLNAMDNRLMAQSSSV